MEQNRVIAASATREDEIVEASIRPKKLADYLGQQAVREQLEIYIEAARRRGEALDHVLIFGPPGLGKTTLSHVIANEMGVALRQTSGPVIERAGDLAALLTNLQPHDVLFIDEIHRLSPVIEEVLYPAMEDFQIDIMIGEGPAARSIKLDLPPFTLIGATTRAGLLTGPLRDRFGIVHRLEFYSIEELTRIVRRSAGILGIACDAEGAVEIARRSRGTPRIGNRLLRRVRDYAQVKADGHISREVAIAAMQMLKVDPEGFDDIDRRLLRTIMETFDGGPVGVESLAAALSEERGTLEDVVEPYLIQQGYIMRTARGRMVTSKAWRHFGLKPPRGKSDADLFEEERGSECVSSCPSCRIIMNATDETHSDPFSSSSPFSFPIRIYWEDTDGGGVVYHARYLHFLERVRTEWLRAQGVGQDGMREREDMVLVVREMQLDFLKPARLDDLLVATMQVSQWRRASFEVVQELLRDGECLLKARVRIACLKASEFKPRPLPDWLAAAQPVGES